METLSVFGLLLQNLRWNFQVVYEEGLQNVNSGKEIPEGLLEKLPEPQISSSEVLQF